MLSFHSPEWFPFALIPFLLLLLVRGKRKNGPFLILTLIRILVLICLLVALAGPQWVRREASQGASLLVGLDHSASVMPSSRDRAMVLFGPVLDTYMEEKGQKIRWFSFNQNSQTFLSRDSLLQSEELSLSPIVASVKNFAPEIGGAPRDRCILFTDGFDTHATLENVGSLAAFGCWFVLLDAKEPVQERIASLKFPTRVRAGTFFDLQVLVESTVKDPLWLSLSSPNQSTQKVALNLESSTAIQTFFQEADEPGEKRFDLSLRREDGTLVHQKQIRLSVVDSRSVLILAQEDASSLEAAVKVAGFSPRVVRPHEAENLEGHAAVLLLNLNRKALEPLEQELVEYVLGGGGLGMFGGDRSFGLGNWFRSDLEEVLPVFCPPRSYRKAVAMIFLIDASGSMLAEDPEIWGDPKKLMEHLAHSPLESRPIYVAKQAAISVLKDLVGVEAGVLRFSDQYSLAVPMSQVSDISLPVIQAGIESIQAGGGTRFLPPLEGALNLLKTGAYEEAHVLLFSDGTPRDAQILVGMLSEFKQMNTPVSTIAFGANANVEVLELIANYTGGGFYRSESLSGLKNSFKEAVDQVFGPPVVLSPTPVSWGKAQNLISSRNPGEPPRVDGYVSTAPKQGIQVLLETSRGEPLAAFWRRGLGGSFVWTSDWGGPWSQNWMQNALSPQVLSVLLEKVARSEQDPLDIHTEVQGREVVIRVQAMDPEGNPFEGLEILGRLKGRGQYHQVQLSPSGKGWFSGRIASAIGGNTDLELEIRWPDKRVEVRVQKIRFAEDVERMRGGVPAELRKYLEQNWPQNLIDSPEGLKKKLGELSRELEIRTPLGFLPGVLALFLLCMEILMRRFRVLEQVQDERQENRYARQAGIWWARARDAARNRDSQEAEKWFLAAHRAAIQAGDDELKRKIFEDMRVRLG